MQGRNGGAWTLDAHLKLYGHNFNSGVSEFIIKELKPTSILEFGCGVGWYCKYMSDNGVEIVHGIEPEKMDESNFVNDGCEQFCFNVTEQEEPEGILSQYDMVLSLEVMEHVPRKFHDRAFDFLASKKPRIVVFGAARVNQGGHGHVAERPEEEWIQEWVKRGYTKNQELTDKARKSCSARNTNHIKNINVYTL